MDLLAHALGSLYVVYCNLLRGVALDLSTAWGLCADRKHTVIPRLGLGALLAGHAGVQAIHRRRARVELSSL